MPNPPELSPNPSSDFPGLQIHPIGFLQTEAEWKFQVPPQPGDGSAVEGVIELLPGHNYEVALRDLEGFSRIWLIWWFHRNRNWRPTTLPPRGRSGRKGTFATRSPYRPNPLALSCVRLLGIEGNKLFIGNHDLLDGSPIFDIKPYISRFDSFPESNSGWYGEMEKKLEEGPDFEVRFSDTAKAVLATQSPPTLSEKIEAVLSVDPYPHRSRRIVEYDDGFRLACGDWRAYYRVSDGTVFINEIERAGT